MIPPVVVMYICLLLGATNQVAYCQIVTKTYCLQAAGYSGVDEVKKDLLLGAKRLAVNELFGELVTATTASENFILTSDQVRTSSIGFVRLDGDIVYSNGESLGEMCVAINAYATEEGREKFKPTTIGKRVCISDPNLTTREIRKAAEEAAIVSALVEYNRKLEQLPRKSLIQLMQQVRYSDSGFVPETETFCTKVTGTIYPVNIVAATALGSINSREPPATDQVFVAATFEGIEVGTLPAGWKGIAGIGARPGRFAAREITNYIERSDLYVETSPVDFPKNFDLEIELWWDYGFIRLEVGGIYISLRDTGYVEINGSRLELRRRLENHPLKVMISRQDDTCTVAIDGARVHSEKNIDFNQDPIVVTNLRVPDWPTRYFGIIRINGRSRE
jgi:hypothetical protein